MYLARLSAFRSQDWLLLRLLSPRDDLIQIKLNKYISRSWFAPWAGFFVDRHEEM